MGGSEPERFAGDPPSPWEGSYGFSRVVAAGGFVFVGGTTSVTPDGAVIGESPYEQTVEILGRIERELGRAGAAISDLVQMRVYVTDIGWADEVGRAYGEVLEATRPLLTMVQVAGLIDPRMLVEIEAMAWVGRTAAER